MDQSRRPSRTFKSSSKKPVGTRRLAQITLGTCLPKGQRVDTMMNMLSQLGVDHVVPLRTEHSVVDPRDSKLDRLTRNAIEAAKQSQRPYLMQIHATQELPEILTGDHDLILLAAPQNSAPCSTT